MKIALFSFFGLAILNTSSQSQNWQPFGQVDYSNAVRTIFHDTVDNSLYIGGYFYFFSGLEARGIVKWDGQIFSTVGFFPNVISGIPASISNAVISIIRYEDQIYCNLHHTPWMLGNIEGIAKWNGVSWESVGAGLKGSVIKQIVFQDELYVMGSFDTVSSQPMNTVARWDGYEWHDPEFPYPTAFINSATIFNEELYIGGNFFTADKTVRDVAKFDGENWYPVGYGGIQGSADDPADLIVYKDELYICGDFRKASGNAGNKIMKLKDNEWVDVGGSFETSHGMARKMLVYHDKLYVFGNFQNFVGGVSVNNIAVWDGERWCGLGSEFNKGIDAASVYNDEIIIGGGWEYVDGMNIESIARWTAGDYLAECGEPLSGATDLAPADHFNLSPNPAHSQIQLSAALPAGYRGPALLSAHNLLGQLVWSQTLETGYAEIQQTLDVGRWPPGVYVFSLEAGGRVWNERVVISEL